MIRLENVRKKFNKKLAVDQVSFQVEEGETLVLLGISGCGKTTTLRMINRLIEPDSGQIYVNGKDIKKQSSKKLRRSIGYVLQNNGLFPHYTVAENISIVPKLLNWDKLKIQERSLQLMNKLHLNRDLSSAYPSELSGGQQQRVGLARALMADPSILLMDEPLGALDPITRTSIRKEFRNLDELKRKTVIMVTHDVNEAFELGDRICLINEGKVIQIGSATDLLFHPQNNFVNAFLEEQRLQLEFKSIRIKELWEYLPLFKSTLECETLSTETSLWEALSISHGTNKILSINNDLTGEIKEAGFDELMKSYTTYKNSR